MSIPDKLKGLAQWVAWRSEDRGGPKQTKVPYDFKTGAPCDVTNPASFSPFVPVSDAMAMGYSGIGFVAVKGGKLVFFDLDNPYQTTVNKELVTTAPGDPDGDSVANSHRTILEHLDTYTEWSPSAKGLRLVIEGEIPDGWRNRVGKVEIYDHSRFLTFTGNHVEGTPLTVEPRQSQLEDIMRSLGLDKANTGSTFESQPETRNDHEVYNAIANSQVGPKFLALYRGDSTGYSSGSEADIALGNFICYFTNNKEQAARIFMGSQHYAQRTKLHNRQDLIERVINKGFDKKPPPISINIAREAATALDTITAPEVGPDTQGLAQFPPGILGYIMYYLHSAAPRPIAEFSLAGAIGLMGGIAGRAYNVRGSGLNQYVAMLGPSSIGKEAIGGGISKLLAEASKISPSAKQFYGPSTLSSAPAILKQFSKDGGGTPSFVSNLGEFGEWLLEHTNVKANEVKKGVYRVLLQLYGLSGFGYETGAIAYSDRDKNISSTVSPALSIIGESVPESFFEACTAKNIQSGFIPRFSIIHYKGLRPPLNLGHHRFKGTTQEIEWFAGFCNYCHQINESQSPIEVQFDADGNRMFAEYLAFTDNKYNEHMNDPAGAVWGRAYVKAMKLAGLRAVGNDMFTPTITAADAQWAIDFANRDVAVLVGKLNEGAIQDASTVSGDDPRQRTVAHVFLLHVLKPYATLKGTMAAETTETMHDTWKMMKYGRLKSMCMLRAPFKQMPSVSRDREFDNVVKDMNDVLNVAEASVMAGPESIRMAQWGIKVPTTKLVAALDVPALQRLTKDD